MPRDRTGELLDDPLAEEEPSCPRRCEKGWVSVMPGYAAREYPDLTDPAELAVIDANMVYPCPRCQPDVFARWHQGHFAPNHGCSECTDVRKGNFRPEKAGTRG